MIKKPNLNSNLSDLGEPLSPGDPLWDLLGQAPTVKPDPFFSRNVLRAVRALPEPTPFWKKPWRFLWIPVATGAAAALLLLAQVRHPDASSNPSAPSEQYESASLAPTIVSPGDEDVVANLDQLLASENTEIWLDPSPL